MSVQFAKHYFTIHDYERMGETGILPATKRYELIEGEIIEMSPIGSRHAACVCQLNHSLYRQVGDAIIVSVQNPIVLDDFSEPQPDITLLKPRADFYRDKHPTAADVLLVIEVADTTLQYDRQVKLPMYALAGIPEALVFNLPDERLEYHADPVNGVYQVTRILNRGESLASSSVSGAVFDVAAIFG